MGERVYTSDRSIWTTVLHAAYMNHVLLCISRRYAWMECEIARFER